MEAAVGASCAAPNSGIADGADGEDGDFIASLYPPQHHNPTQSTASNSEKKKKPRMCECSKGPVRAYILLEIIDRLVLGHQLGLQLLDREGSLRSC
jgi:hypothetical protein